MNLSCVLGADLSRSMYGEKKSQNLSGSLSDIIFVLPLTYCSATHDLNENFTDQNLKKKESFDFMDTSVGNTILQM